MNKSLFNELEVSLRALEPPKGQLLKWIGSKYRFAKEIVSHFPSCINTYYEPFLGSGAVLATLAWKQAVGADSFSPLIELWQTLVKCPETVIKWYSDRWHLVTSGDKKEVYEQIKSSYNQLPNAADLLFLCRACYGGVVRFRQADGYMSTPCGIHNPILPKTFAKRVQEWHQRVKTTTFLHLDYKETMEMAKQGDFIYCDPPYNYSQPILYGSQRFTLESLFETITVCKSRGVYVALSIDGSKQSGKVNCELPIPTGLFEREVFIDCGRSMLKRFQMNGKSLENEVVHDRLLLTY